MTRRKKLGVALVATALTLAASSALAGSGAEKQLTVQYGDLDLTRPEGVLALYHRIELAAERVCGDGDGRDLQQRARVRACRREALDAGVASMQNEELSKLHDEKTGGALGSEVAKRE